MLQHYSHCLMWGIFFPPLFPCDTHTYSLSLPLSSRCCQGNRAAGEAAGVRWRPRSQAPVSEEGPSERVLHSHQRGGSPSRARTAGPWTSKWIISFHFFHSVILLFVFKCFAWPFLCRQSSLWLFCNALPINHCAEFFFLGDVVCEFAAFSESASEILYWSPGHICCVFHHKTQYFSC